MVWPVEATPKCILSIAEYCTKWDVTTSVQTGQQCYDAPIKQEETEEISLSSGLL